MSKTHVFPSIKQPVGKITLPPRISRHNRLLTETFMVAVPAVTERKILLNKDTNEYEPVLVTISEGGLRPMTEAEIKQARHEVLRAQGPTTKWGQKNTRVIGKKKAEVAKPR
jgi:hypothetical protein